MQKNLFIKEYSVGILNYASIVFSNAKKIFRQRLKKEHLAQHELWCSNPLNGDNT